MKIELESKFDFSEYGAFGEKIENFTFFHSAKYLSLLEKLLKIKISAITARENNQLEGVLPFFIKESTHGKVINSSPYFGSYGGVLSKSNEIKKKLLEEFNSFNVQNDVLSAVIISNPFDENKDLYSKYFKFHSVEKKISQCTILEGKSESDLWSKLEKRVRGSVKKSEKNDIVVKNDIIDNKQLTDFYNTHTKSMKEKNAQSKSLDFFKLVKENFIQKKDFDIFIGYKNSIPLSFLLIFYYYPFAEYYMPAQKEEYKELQVNSLLIWKSMESAIKKEMKFYNFGGTPMDNKDLHRFKRGWDAIEFPYDYFIYRDIDRIRNIGLVELKKLFNNFYVVPYAEIT